MKIFYVRENSPRVGQFYRENSFGLAKDYVQIACAQIKQFESASKWNQNFLLFPRASFGL